MQRREMIRFWAGFGALTVVYAVLAGVAGVLLLH